MAVSEAPNYYRLSFASGQSSAQIDVDRRLQMTETSRLHQISEWLRDFSFMREIGSLGEGSFGFVKMAEDGSTHKHVALNSFHSKTGSKVQANGMRQRFMNAVELLIHLSHPCVLSIVGYSVPTLISPARIGTRFAVNG
jgi:serine/threonine protein kinase